MCVCDGGGVCVMMRGVESLHVCVIPIYATCTYIHVDWCHQDQVLPRLHVLAASLRAAL